MRKHSGIDDFQNNWLNQLVADSPLLATSLGLDSNQDKLDDFSPANIESRLQKLKNARAELSNLVAIDHTDQVSKHAMLEDFDSEIEIVESNLPYRDLNNIASPLQEIRNAFDLMPRQTPTHWQNIASRMEDIQRALEEHAQTLSVGIEKQTVPAQRQIEQVLNQIPGLMGREGFFGQLATSGGQQFPELANELSSAAKDASGGLEQYGQFLSGTLYATSNSEDAFGREHYELLIRRFLGIQLDLDETYLWGIDQLEIVVNEQKLIANQIEASAGIERAIHLLDSDPRYQIHGVDNLRKWMQQTSDKALKQLSGKYFDIPEKLQALECMIAPTDQGGIYYTQPSEDFSRPGRMWWSIPKGVETFSTWREKTTVFHEGVPGHHLQLGWQVYNKQQLNDWRRNVSWTSGHGEGWALYAEQLMREFGFLSDPGDLMGMLDAQRMRAARVVLDIGVHLGKKNPDGGPWNYEYAMNFMRQNVSMKEKALEFEVNRYFGWPGQAPSYKIGQRVINELRQQQLQQLGSKFDLKSLHHQILKLGGLGLGSLRFAFGQAIN